MEGGAKNGSSIDDIINLWSLRTSKRTLFVESILTKGLLYCIVLMPVVKLKLTHVKNSNQASSVPNL